MDLGCWLHDLNVKRQGIVSDRNGRFCDQHLKIVTNIFRCPTSVTDTNIDPEVYF